MSAETWALTSPGSARDLETDHADREDDPTPRGVVRAALEAAICLDIEDGPCVGVDHDDSHGPRCSGRPIGDLFRWEHLPVRALDVCAGYGCWASELRRLAGLQGWPVHITGVELFEPRRVDLAKWCDEVWIGDWESAVWAETDLGDANAFDLAIGNPHFTALTHDDPAQSMPAVLLRHAPAVLLLHTQQAFARGEAGRRVWRAYPPAASWVVPGSVKFRTGTNPATGKPWGSDSRCYQVSLWLRGHEGPTALHLLPELDAAARRWTVPPGSEQPSAELPAAPGWAP